jgi:hypothetical protein
MSKQKIQGEGDYEATRRYRKRTDEEIEERERDLEAMAFDPEKYSRFAD